jgi:ketosteroid isomerase-like protein
MTKEPCVFFCHHPFAAFENEAHAFLDRILTVDKSWMHSFDPQSKKSAEWRARTPPRKKIARLTHDALKVMNAKMDFCLTITCQ